MPLSVDTNLDALEAQRHLGLTSMDFSKSVQALSSGLRITSAADDAAGLAISQKLRTQITGFDQASRNAQDAISMLQTGESALGTSQAMLQRMRQLAVQAANDTYTDQDRHTIQAEISQLISEIDRISQQTDFNTKKLLDGSTSAQIAGGGPDIKAIVAQAGVAIATTFQIVSGQNATRSVFQAGASVQGSFFTQTSSITITGGLGTQTFTAHQGESLEDFFQQVDNSGIGATMEISQSLPGTVLVVNNNYGLYDATYNSTGVTQVSVASATGDFATTGLGMNFGGGWIDSMDSSGQLVGGPAVNAIVELTAGAANTEQVLVGTGASSDTVEGKAMSAGLDLTLSTPGDLGVSHPAVTGITSTINVGTTPTGLDVDPRSNTIYIANQGSNTVSVIDGNTNTVTATITVGSTPYNAAVDQANNSVYITNHASNFVSVIDEATNQTTNVVVGAGANNVAVDSATNTIYVTNNVTNTTSVIDGATNTVTATIATGTDGIDANSVTNTIYAANAGANTLAVIDGATNAIKATVTLANSPGDVRVNKATNTIYVAESGSNKVVAIDGATNAIKATITTANTPTSITVDGAHNLVYVTSATGPVTIIDGNTNTVLGSVASASATLGGKLDAATNTLYVTNGAGTVSVFTAPTTAADQVTVTQNTGLHYQVGANANQTVEATIDAANSQALGVGSLSVLTRPDAETAIAQLDRAIQAVSAARARIGATINRLTNSLKNDQSAQENASASTSRIVDVNVAQQTVQFTHDQILLQAGTSVLAQANQASSGLLALLR